VAFIRVMYSEISPVFLSSQFMATDAIFEYKDDQKVDFNHRDSIHEFGDFGSFLQDMGRKRVWKNTRMSYYRREGPAAKVINAGAGASGAQVKRLNPKVNSLRKYLTSVFYYTSESYSDFLRL